MRTEGYASVSDSRGTTSGGAKDARSSAIVGRGVVGTNACVHTGLYLDLVEGAFMIPPYIWCDCMLLLYGFDARYVESVERYLFKGDIAYPGY